MILDMLLGDFRIHPDFVIASRLGAWGLAMGLTLWGTWVARRLLASPPPHLDAPFNLYPVSIIKPLKGIDAALEDNLEGFFGLDYPDYELLFCVANAGDPAIAVASRLMARHPGTRARLLVGETVVGPNPKVNNMIRAYEQARHDWVLVSDSNVSVGPAYLKRLVAHLRPGVGIVTAVVAGDRAGGLGGNLEATYLNTFYARGMCLAHRVGRACVIGKSMLFRRSVARRFGGLRALGRYLAEDYMAGEAMRRLGLEVVIAADPVRQVVGHGTVGAFWRRHLRWGRIRKKHGLGAFLFEPFSGALASGVIGASAFSSAFGFPMPLFLILHLGIWSLCDIYLMYLMKTRLMWSTPIYWFLREAAALPLWAHIAAGNTVEWRGHRLEIRSGGVLEHPNY